MAHRPKTARKVERVARPTPRRNGANKATKVRPTTARDAKVSAVREIREKLGVNRQVFSRLSQFSERAIAKWEAGEPLSAPSQQRMSELKRLYQALSRVMRSDSVGQWLQTPNEAFADLKPLEVVERGETDRIWRMIYLMESGVPS